MTFLNHTRREPQRFSVRLYIAALSNWWQERQLLKREHRKLAELPNHILRDVGLEHLIDLDPNASSYHRLW